MVRRNLQKSSQSRVFIIEDRAGPSHVPQYQTHARMTGITRDLGGITPVRIADPQQYGRYLTIDKIKGQAGLPSTTLEYRTTREVSDMLKLANKGCPIDVQLHIGACKDPSDFDLGWEKIIIIEDAEFTNYSTSELGAFDADQEIPTTETLDLMGIDHYELKPLEFARIGESQIVQEVVDVVICDSRTCGACGLPSNGCQRIFAMQVPAGASPGLPSEVISSQDGGATWQEQVITTLPANVAPTAMECVGPYLAVISNGDDSIHYALITDLLEDTSDWTEIVTGIVAAGSPNNIVSLGRTQTWIVGDGGYIYFSDDITAGVEVQSSGDVTAQNLTTIHPFDESNLLAGGAANALVVTRDGGLTWSLVTGPSGQAAVAVTAVHMLSENEWIVGYGDGEVWYTVDGGENWTQKTLPGALTVVDDIKFATRSVGYLAGHTATVGKLLRTINGGNTWYVLPEASGLSIPTALEFNAIAACGDDPNFVLAGGLKTAGGDGIVVKGA